MYRFIAQKKYIRLLFSINGKNIHQLSKESDMTICHLSNVMDQWKREGLVTKEKKGRETDIKITELGKELSEILRQYDEIATKQINKLKSGKTISN